MDDERYGKLITRLEAAARAAPGRYLRAVVAIALLGFLILGLALGISLFMLAGLAGLAVLVIASGGKALLVLFKVGKLLIVLAVPAWTMTKSSVKLLFSRFPRPAGRSLTAAEAPVLFERLREMHARLGGPPVHAVLLIDDLNAAIVQHPRLGLFGWHENILMVGLPLLQTLSEGEALAVVAHEYGHLSGHHSRLGGFIYRLRTSWANLQALSEQWQDWGSRLVARLFRWYAPYFNAYTFVFARENEYIADQAAVELLGRDIAASALMRVNIAARFQASDFWPAVRRRVADEPEPVANRSALWTQALREQLGRAARARFLDAERLRTTDHHDTHPALADRLRAMGVTPDDSAAAALEAPAVSAAQAWLGAALEGIAADFDRAWSAQVAASWRERHAELQACRKRLETLETAGANTIDEQWELINLSAQLRPDSDQLPPVQALLEREPSHQPARFRRGGLLLARGDAAGIDDIEAVMAQDENAILAGCEMAWRFYQGSAPEKAQAYRARYETRIEQLQRVQAEAKTLTPDARLEPAAVSTEQLEAIRSLLRANDKYIARAYLLRRRLRADNRLSDLVLAFETSRFTLGNKGPEVTRRLAALPFAEAMFIVHLGARPFKGFRKIIERQRVQPLLP